MTPARFSTHTRFLLSARQSGRLPDHVREQVHLALPGEAQVAADDGGLRIAVIEHGHSRVQLIVYALGPVVSVAEAGHPRAHRRGDVPARRADHKLTHRYYLRFLDASMLAGYSVSVATHLPSAPQFEVSIVPRAERRDPDFYRAIEAWALRALDEEPARAADLIARLAGIWCSAGCAGAG
jgi:hypothetical protein